MKSLFKIFEKTKGKPLYSVILVAAILIVILALFFLSGIGLIFGLNLMGLAIPYTWKTILGSFILFLWLKPTSFGSSEK